MQSDVSEHQHRHQPERHELHAGELIECAAKLSGEVDEAQASSPAPACRTRASTFCERVRCNSLSNSCGRAGQLRQRRPIEIEAEEHDLAKTVRSSHDQRQIARVLAGIGFDLSAHVAQLRHLRQERSAGGVERLGRLGVRLQRRRLPQRHQSLERARRKPRQRGVGGQTFSACAPTLSTSLPPIRTQCVERGQLRDSALASCPLDSIRCRVARITVSTPS